MVQTNKLSPKLKKKWLKALNTESPYKGKDFTPSCISPEISGFNLNVVEFNLVDWLKENL